jgi:hypothetical protein
VEAIVAHSLVMIWLVQHVCDAGSDKAEHGNASYRRRRELWAGRPGHAQGASEQQRSRQELIGRQRSVVRRP